MSQPPVQRTWQSSPDHSSSRNQSEEETSKHIRGVSEGTWINFRMYALAHNVTLAEALEKLLDTAYQMQLQEQANQRT